MRWRLQQNAHQTRRTGFCGEEIDAKGGSVRCDFGDLSIISVYRLFSGSFIQVKDSSQVPLYG